jgi:hypothetical protein
VKRSGSGTASQQVRHSGLYFTATTTTTPESFGGIGAEGSEPQPEPSEPEQKTPFPPQRGVVRTEYIYRAIHAHSCRGVSPHRGLPSVRRWSEGQRGGTGEEVWGVDVCLNYSLNYDLRSS